jgi:hypothetical protein
MFESVELRKGYLQALQLADKGNFTSLINFARS